MASSSRPGQQQQQQRAAKAKKAKSVWERHDLMPHALIRAIYKEGKVESAAVGEEGENGATLVKFHRYFFSSFKVTTYSAFINGIIINTFFNDFQRRFPARGHAPL